MSERPARVIDPVCGMEVDVAQAEQTGRVADHDGRRFAFCRVGCRDAFLADPGAYVVPVSAGGAATAATVVAAGHGPAASADEHGHPGPAPVIDEGMRLWYEACPCCLGDTFPEIRAALDAERAAAGRDAAGPGICEVEDGMVPASAPAVEAGTGAAPQSGAATWTTAAT